jgi:hypothetical protein
MVSAPKAEPRRRKCNPQTNKQTFAQRSFESGESKLNEVLRKQALLISDLIRDRDARAVPANNISILFAYGSFVSARG